MIGACFIGSVLNFLLLHLCCENALWQRWMIEEYGHGCKFLCQKFYHWLTDFDCFRVSFLIMIAQDAPMTVMNFWFISSCSIPQPDKPAWPFYLSCSTTLTSLIWRGVMLFLAYRNVRFVEPSYMVEDGASGAGAVAGIGAGPGSQGWTDVYPKRESTTRVIRNAIGLGNRGRRLGQYDECWSVRASLWLSHRKDHFSLPIDEPESLLKKCGRAMCCCLLCPSLCFLCIFAGCIPCCHYYTCRKNAGVNRQRFARTCTRYCTVVFHGVVLSLSLFLLISLIVLNVLWLSSVHLAGNDRTAPELGLLCVSVDRWALEASVGLRPTTSPNLPNSALSNVTTECKPLFDQNGWGFWWQRRKPTPWILLKKFDNAETLAIWTNSYVSVGGSAKDPGTRPVLAYDLAYKEANQACIHLGHQWFKWTVISDPLWNRMPWPYGLACDCLYDVVRSDQRLCNAMF